MEMLNERNVQLAQGMSDMDRRQEQRAATAAETAQQQAAYTKSILDSLNGRGSATAPAPTPTMDPAATARFTVNALFNGLPPYLKPPLVRFRTAGTVEELVEAAISLDAAMQGAREETANRRNNNNNNNRQWNSRNEGGQPSSPNQQRRFGNSNQFQHQNQNQNSNFSGRGFQRRTTSEDDYTSPLAINAVEGQPTTTPSQEGERSQAVRDAEVFKDLDKPIVVRIQNGIRYVRLGGRNIAQPQFRSLCYVFNRCYNCGGQHQMAACHRRDDPLFPRQPSNTAPPWTQRGQNTPTPNSASANLKPWVNRNARPQNNAVNAQELGGELPDGDYAFSKPEDVLQTNVCNTEPRDRGVDAQDDMTQFYAPFEGDDTFYDELGESYDCELAAIEVIPIASVTDTRRFDLLPMVSRGFGSLVKWMTAIRKIFVRGKGPYAGRKVRKKSRKLP